MSKKFTKDHEWIDVEGDVARIGITNYAQEQLGDVVFVELPEAGRQFQQGNDAAVVESVKAASEVYAPVSGEIVEPNTKLEDDPALVNQDPTESGWFFTMKVSNPDELNDLMDEAAYADYVKELG
ncbi:MAG: glycine cleavage system protein GcvH [Pseudomonadota bacterium]|jgi:glycine cleavage system H protein|nr:glycine cleavage system protein H [Hyphomicrobiales bacterium]MEC6998305.1 glycine cleavage system protein GcvH [Pseudomonadota bacterium]MEC7475798.1 glycine cleavage system protein GcvH [Pseudomonadota bacterium]MEC8210570.1 glycine cleavage system protein GcvH [Pseudomonadota bacterium]MEC8316909.1 glycine cleavage system protein GcvH [Pseudomonadota bacterium]|tara:strand:- start:253 stop:627 length:375 start_codon:yes stop_codon:yes gene_type:complete